VWTPEPPSSHMVFVHVPIPDMPKQGLWVDEIGTDEGITGFRMV
jgi:hypothetical protein